MSRALAGTATVTLDGMSVNVAGTCRYLVCKKKRSTLKGMSGVHGYKEEHTQGFIEIEVRDSGSMGIADFDGYTNVTVVAILANGKTIIGENMWTVNEQEVDTNEATFTLRFEGRDVSEH